MSPVYRNDRNHPTFHGKRKYHPPGVQNLAFSTRFQFTFSSNSGQLSRGFRGNSVRKNSLSRNGPPEPDLPLRPHDRRTSRSRSKGGGTPEPDLPLRPHDRRTSRPPPSTFRPPQGSKFDPPQGSKNDPPGPKNDPPRDQNLTPQDHKLTPPGPKVHPLGPKVHPPRRRNFTPTTPDFLTRSPSSIISWREHQEHPSPGTDRSHHHFAPPEGGAKWFTRHPC